MKVVVSDVHLCYSVCTVCFIVFVDSTFCMSRCGSCYVVECYGVVLCLTLSRPFNTQPIYGRLFSVCGV